MTSQRPCWCTRTIDVLSFGNQTLSLCIFHAYILYCFVHQYGRQVTWVKTIYRPPPFSCVNDVVVKLISKYLHKKSSEVSIKARSTPASLSCIRQVTKYRTVKWSIKQSLPCIPWPTTLNTNKHVLIVILKCGKLLTGIPNTLWQ